MKPIYLLSFLVLFSCSEKQDKDIIPKEQFTNILEEIYLKESESQFNKIKNSDYQEILSEHKFQSKGFQNKLEEDDELKHYCYNRICEARILKYDSKQLGIDDVVETDETVDEI